MTNNDQAAIDAVSTKTVWVKPEIVSEVSAVDAEGAGAANLDGNATGS